MKYEWKKEEKELYAPEQEPQLITVPKLKYFTISGKDNPNSEEFFEKIGVLYSLAYAVRMMPKSGFTPEGYFEYTVYPLEGIWDLTKKGKKSNSFNKDELLYTIMIRQPEFVTNEVVKQAYETAQKKKPHPFLSEVKFEEIEDGLCVQMLHIGSFDDEPQSFKKMEEFVAINGLERRNLTHREISVGFSKNRNRQVKNNSEIFCEVILCKKAG